MWQQQVLQYDVTYMPYMKISSCADIKQLVLQYDVTYIPYMKISSCADIKQLCQYIYFIWTHFEEQCDQKHWYTFISHYCHMSLNKYACHIAYVCPAACLLYYTYRPNITAHLSKINDKMPLPYVYQILHKYAPEIPYAHITKCPSRREVCQYIWNIFTHWHQVHNKQCCRQKTMMPKFTIMMQPDCISRVDHWPMKSKTLACMIVFKHTQTDSISNSLGCDVTKPNQPITQNQSFHNHHTLLKIKIIQK